jgi:hypothetical protein
MKQMKILSDFAFAHRGYQVREYRAGEVVDADDAEFVEVSVREGWARSADLPEAKAKKGAPENKSKGGA